MTGLCWCLWSLAYILVAFVMVPTAMDGAVLCVDGHAATGIVVSSNATDRINRAAGELKDYRQRITGGELSITQGKGGEGIAVGTADEFPDLLFRDVLRVRNIGDRERYVLRSHAKGLNPFVPELMEIGLDALNPLEVKAGMDPAALKKQYGDKLVFHGGINAVLWDKPDKIKEEIERVVPLMKENGGYIFGTDHSIPSCVSLEDFGEIVKLAKRVGSYA